MNLPSVLFGAGAAALPPAPAAPATAGGGAAGALARTAPPSAGLAASPASASGGGLLGGILRGLTLTSAQGNAEALGGLLSRFLKSAVTGGAAGSTNPSAASGSTGSLAFLKDARLSVEEKLARLMVHLSDKYEKQLEEKLRQYGDLESTGKTGASATAKKSTASSSPLAALGDGLAQLASKAGLLGGSGAASTLLPRLASQLAAPVLAGAATALGMPALAPMLLKSGPLLGSLASGAVSALTGASGKATATTKSSSASSSTSGAPSEKQLMTEIQILQEKQKEMFTLVSNILRSLHDTRMAVIGNIR